MNLPQYEVYALGPAARLMAPAVQREVEAGFRALGLDIKSNLGWHSTKPHQQNAHSSCVGVWFGSLQPSSKEDESLLGFLLKSLVPVYPVVETIDEYTKCTPSVLHAINGQLFHAPTIAACILKSLRLTRAQRQAFVSYKRTESQAAATQIFTNLTLAGYRPFLDTASVCPGVDFQEALWSRMADTDLLIFLDTPHALDSGWVYQELARAHDLGLGVLQILWPNKQRSAGTDLSDIIELSDSDISASGHLTDATCARILTAAEKCRIRSIAARRRRVVDEFVDLAQGEGFDVRVQPAGNIELEKGGKVFARGIPIVGLPDAVLIHDCECVSPKAELTRTRLIYSGLGMSKSWRSHLDWLNIGDGLVATSVDDAQAWLASL